MSCDSEHVSVPAPEQDWYFWLAIWIGTVMRIAVIMSGVVVMYPSTLNRPNPNPEEGAVPAPCSNLAELQGTSRT